jgi:hypothetical protein
MIGFAGDFALLQTEGQNAKENGYEAQNEDSGRQAQTQPQRHGSWNRSLFLRKGQDRGASCGDCRARDSCGFDEWAIVAILRAAAQARTPLARHKDLVRDYRNTDAAKFQAVAARKGECHEAQDEPESWKDQPPPQPQHHRPLTAGGALLLLASGVRTL